MVEKELLALIERIRLRGCEAQTTEVKAAHGGCPEKLYDTISSFSNQDSGGVFVFGLDERLGFAKVGVYDAQDLQKKVMEYCEQMTPIVRPVFTVCNEGELIFVSAEIPPVDIADRPCFKTAKGRMQGSYIRVGDADKPMKEYEIYSYEAFRKKSRDDIRPVEDASLALLDQSKLDEYFGKRKQNRPHLAAVSREQLYELTSITRNAQITLAALLLFGVYPQASYPQMSIIATHIPCDEMGVLDVQGNRFIDSKRIEGTLPEMLDSALSFVSSNMRIATRIDPRTGKRQDVPQYPMDAVREAVLNALVHRDYSMHTENMPIQLRMYTNRMEISNPGGLYGRLTVDQLGHAQPDTRNPVLVTAMETLGKTENRYSGIPRIRQAMQELSLPEPEFSGDRTTFSVVLYNKAIENREQVIVQAQTDEKNIDPKGLLAFCKTPRSRAEIMAFLDIASGNYALRRYLNPLIAGGLIRMTLPDKPKSTHQKYVSSDQI